MKKFLLPLAVFSVLLLPAQGVFACCQTQASDSVPFVYYLNPLPYIGIGENKTDFSLNPLKGFKNCDKCKKVKKDKCGKCVGAAAPVCPSCKRAFPKRESCDCKKVHPQAYVPTMPDCPCKIK